MNAAIGTDQIKQGRHCGNQRITDQQLRGTIAYNIVRFLRGQCSRHRRDVEASALSRPVYLKKFRTVGDPHGDSITAAQAILTQQMRTLIRPSFHLAIGQCLAGFSDDDSGLIRADGSVDTRMGHAVKLSRRFTIVRWRSSQCAQFACGQAGGCTPSNRCHAQ
jgi:hypothetical protein